jgi:outer membrane lipase/esterase
VTALTPALSCRSCRPNAPFAELLKLSRLGVTDEWNVEREGGAWRMRAENKRWQAWLAAGDSTGNANKTARIAAAIAAGTNGAPVGAGNLSNSQFLASLFGLSAVPADQTGGTNYAISGSLDAATPANGNVGNLGESTVDNPANTNVGLPSTVQQIANYLNANGGHANPNGIYLISSGGNETTFADDNPAFTTLAQREAYVAAQAELLAAAITGLQAAGARYILVNSIGLNTTSILNNLQTQTLWSQLAANRVNFIPAHAAAVVAAAQFNPTLFGFTPSTVLPGVTGTGTGSACVWTGGTQTGWAQWCANTTTPSASYAYLQSSNAEQTSLFADDEHLSAAGQLMEADYDYSLIVAPSEISYLAEMPVKTRTTVVNSIYQQIQVSQQQRAVGSFNAWVSGDISSASMGNSNGFPTDPGTPGMVTVGADYSWAPNWLVGGAVSVGTTTQSFSLGGNFQQNEYALSAYVAYAGKPVWFDVITSYGGLHYDVDRVVPIGITTVSNTGSTNGSNASFATELGYNFTTNVGHGWDAAPLLTKAAPMPAGLYLTHGPVAGILLQQIYVDGFRETDPFAGDATGGFTALSYAGQVRDSAVTELGYQVSTDIGIWHPYAKLAWNHELVSSNRLVAASLTTIAAPSYSMPAVILGRDWGTATLGTTVALGHGMTGYASFTSEIAQNQATYYGGLIGVSVALNGPSPPLVIK